MLSKSSIQCIIFAVEYKIIHMAYFYNIASYLCLVSIFRTIGCVNLDALACPGYFLWTQFFAIVTMIDKGFFFQQSDTSQDLMQRKVVFLC